MASTSSEKPLDIVDIIINDMDNSLGNLQAKSKKRSSKSKPQKESASCDTEKNMADSHAGTSSELLGIAQNTHAESKNASILSPEAASGQPPATGSPYCPQGDLVTSQATQGMPQPGFPTPPNPANAMNLGPASLWHSANFYSMPQYPWGQPPYFFPHPQWQVPPPPAHGHDVPSPHHAVDLASVPDIDAGTDPTSMQPADQLDLGEALAAQLSDVSSDDGSDTSAEAHPEQSMASILSDMEDFFDVDEATGPDTLPKIANIVNTGFRTSASTEKTKSLCDQYSRPANCTSLVVPKLNDEIYHTLSKHAQQRDKGLQLTQKLILSASFPLIRVMEFLFTNNGKTDPQKMPETSR